MTAAAIEMLRTGWAADHDATHSAKEFISATCGTGASNRPARLRAAETWDFLARRGLICPDPDQLGRIWFLTQFGRMVLRSSDPEGELKIDRLYGS
jgi:hypothetical protein